MRLPEFNRWRLFKQDAVEWLRALPSGSVDLCVTDPAYESLEKHRAIGTTTRLKKSDGSSNEWFEIFPNERFPTFFRELFRVMKKNAHVYIFSDVETMLVMKPDAERAGFKWWDPIVWDKETIGMGYHWRKRYEMITFLEKGKRKLRDLSEPNVIREKRVLGYPTEKPVPVMKRLILNSSERGEIVIDPFFGSGATGEAAILNGRRFLGTDTSGIARSLAAQRLTKIDEELGEPKPAEEIDEF